MSNDKPKSKRPRLFHQEPTSSNASDNSSDVPQIKRVKRVTKKFRSQILLVDASDRYGKECYTQEALEETHTDTFEELRDVISSNTFNLVAYGIPSDGILPIRQIWKEDTDLDNENTFLTVAGASLKKSDLFTLKSLQLLNDEVINAYMKLIIKRAEETPGFPKVYAFDTFFYPTFRDHGYEKVSRWTRKVDIFSYDLVYVPIFANEHWALLIWDFEHKHKVYCDSMDFEDEKIATQVASYYFREMDQYLLAEATTKQKKDFTTRSLKKILVNRPIQHNDIDCGVYLCSFAEFTARRCTCYDFLHEFIFKFRQKICYELLMGKLMWTKNGRKVVEEGKEEKEGEDDVKTGEFGMEMKANGRKVDVSVLAGQKNNGSLSTGQKNNGSLSTGQKINGNVKLKKVNGQTVDGSSLNGQKADKNGISKREIDQKVVISSSRGQEEVGTSSIGQHIDRMWAGKKQNGPKFFGNGKTCGGKPEKRLENGGKLTKNEEKLVKQEGKASKNEGKVKKHEDTSLKSMIQRLKMAKT
ncbi:unnamed protein product [Bursaphelenchus okinawaensis]|uniref:Ubiquitin-like protease family profile domain-containing protein n=1 Tax=Bursaphelenchus okinawaensis TaxID=465554 RepID=A0A811K396_9BILA|nr:unnamed protein product [Bursaphelenchus okinawaensis]CAG9089680.1 unnamed protein product [Bursaphelenchus okinawaensis]